MFLFVSFCELPLEKLQELDLELGYLHLLAGFFAAARRLPFAFLASLQQMMRVSFAKALEGVLDPPQSHLLVLGVPVEVEEQEEAVEMLLVEGDNA